MELDPEQKRRLGRVYAYILSLAANAKKKQAPVSQSLADNKDTEVEKDTRQQTVIPSTRIPQFDT